MKAMKIVDTYTLINMPELGQNLIMVIEYDTL